MKMRKILHSTFFTKFLVLSSQFLVLGSLHAQGFGFSFSGSVNPQVWLDTRQTVGAREEMLDFYPKPIGLDAMGRDTNAVPMLNMLAITNRLAVTVYGPDVLGAKVKGYIETDFTGSTDGGVNSLRLRHGYVDMQWPSTKLLLGHYWHPMVVHEIMPGTRPLNMGAPFHPYARYNQVRVDQSFGRVGVVLTSGFQRDNTSQGPYGRSSSYLKHSLVPELDAQLRYTSDHLFLGAAAHLVSIRPRPLGDNFSHITFSLFGKYDFNGWSIKAQTLIMGNLYEYSSMGGYVETPLMAADSTLSYRYDAYTYNTYWVDFGRTEGRWRPGLLLAYARNNDYAYQPEAGASVYGRGLDIEYLYRIQPRIGFVAGGGLSFYAEVEHTFAQYRSGGVSNQRFILSAVYAFATQRKQL